jgi:hypothetical protein
MEKSNEQAETKPCTIHGVMWRILFIVVCACVWAVSYQLIQKLPTFWHAGTPMFIGWVSHMAYQRLFT